MYTVVPALVRRALDDYVVQGKYKIEKGTNIIIPATAIHMDPDLYPQPQIFNPDNFLPSNIAKRHPYSFIPMSKGHRNCIGKFLLKNP